MTLTLFVLAMVAAANPFRALSAQPPDPSVGVRSAAIAVCLLLTGLAATLADPFLELVDVTGSSARIAAGVALVAVSLKDLLARPPTAEPALRGWRAGIIPLAFPVIFSPAVALLAVAGSADRGVAFVMLGTALALLPLVGVLWWVPSRRARVGASVVGALGVGIAVLVVMDGVYAI